MRIRVGSFFSEFELYLNTVSLSADSASCILASQTRTPAGRPTVAAASIPIWKTRRIYSVLHFQIESEKELYAF